MILRHYRILHNLHDGRSNQTLRFPRTAEEAGIQGKPIDDDGPSLHSFPAMLLWGAVGALGLWVFLALVLGLGQ